MLWKCKPLCHILIIYTSEDTRELPYKAFSWLVMYPANSFKISYLLGNTACVYINSYIKLAIDVIVNVLLYFQAFLFLEVAL